MLLVPKEVGALLGVHPKTVIRLFVSGELRGFKCGPRLWKTTREEYDAYVRSKLNARDTTKTGETIDNQVSREIA